MDAENRARASRAFKESLESVAATCDNCGFVDAIFGGEWRTRASVDARSGHLVYELACPDCATVRQIEVNLP